MWKCPTVPEVLSAMIADRYERRSLAITSNPVLSDWERILANPMTTAPSSWNSTSPATGLIQPCSRASRQG